MTLLSCHDEAKCRAEACLRRAVTTIERFDRNAQLTILPGGVMTPPYILLFSGFHKKSLIFSVDLFTNSTFILFTGVL